MSDLGARIRELRVRTRPAVPPERIREWEDRLDIRLPEAYVSFVTQVGDGWEKQVISRSLWPEMRSLFACGEEELLGRPFPYTAPWIWEDRETNPLPDESGEAWNRRVDELMRPKRFGNIPLLRGACGECFHLIVNGACAGEVWRFTDVGIAPCSPSAPFSQWLAAWLEERG